LQESKTNIDICAFFGSPRADGYSSKMHEAFLSKAHNKVVRRFHIYEMKINPCMGCHFCKKNLSCYQKDDMSEIYDTVKSSNLLTFSFPLYFSSIPGPMKTMIDRFQLLWEESNRGIYPLKNQRAMSFISAGSEYKDMLLPSVKILTHLMNSIEGEYLRDESFLCNGLDKENGNEKFKRILSDIEDRPDRDDR
jgi:multimeric flavodoxin WrbA